MSYFGGNVPDTLSEAPRLPGERDGLPRVFSAPHPDAVASRGDAFVAFAEHRRGGPLRWFQWLTAQRRYEVNADGAWCWPLVFESTPRQQGKSVTLAEDAAWYCSQTTQPELVLHAAHRVKTSLDVQSDLWAWAEGSGLEVRRLLGDSRIMWPHGAVWATVAVESSYGRRPWRLLLDEAWCIPPVKFWNSLYPALGDRQTPQALFWSTANPDDQGLVADLRTDTEVCRMEWGALEGQDFADPAVWRSASAYWGPGREQIMARASTKPGFAEEWLNVWPVSKAVAARWLPEAVTEAVACVLPWPADDLGIVGVESRWNSYADGPGRWAVALALEGSVKVRRVDTLADVAQAAGDRRIVCHETVRQQLAAVGRGWRVEVVNTAGARASAQTLADLLRAGQLQVDGIDEATWDGVRVFPSDAGDAVDSRRSPVDVAGVKAAAYAVHAWQSVRHSFPILIA